MFLIYIQVVIKFIYSMTDRSVKCNTNFATLSNFFLKAIFMRSVLIYQNKSTGFAIDKNYLEMKQGVVFYKIE